MNSARYSSRWRLSAAPIIARVLEEMKGKPQKDIREALRLAYPFGAKAMYPYKSAENRLREWEAIYGRRKRVTTFTELLRWAEGS